MIDRMEHSAPWLTPRETNLRVVEVIHITPCPECLREAKYTVLHIANDELATRAAGPLRHDQLHEVVYCLEHTSEQVPVGICECGADGAETGSATLIHLSRREPTGWVCDDLSYQIVSVRLVDAVDRQFAPHPKA